MYTFYIGTDMCFISEQRHISYQNRYTYHIITDMHLISEQISVALIRQTFHMNIRDSLTDMHMLKFLFQNNSLREQFQKIVSEYSFRKQFQGTVPYAYTHSYQYGNSSDTTLVPG